MSRGRKLAALIALASTATPGVAFDNPAQLSPGVTFFFRVPLEAPDAKKQAISAGFTLQGNRPYETLTIDSRMLNSFFGTGLEAKFVVAGVVAAGAAAAVASKDKSTAASYEAAQAEEKKKKSKIGGGGGGGEPCPVTPQCPPK